MVAKWFSVHRGAKLSLAGVVLGALSLVGLAVPGSGIASATIVNNISASVPSLGFTQTTLGTVVEQEFAILNVTNAQVTIDVSTGFTYSGPDPNDFVAIPDLSSCVLNGDVVSLAPDGDPSSTCGVDVFFLPGALGQRSATLTVDSTDTTVQGATVALNGTGTIGYYQVDAAGDVAPFGDAGYYGDLGGMPLNKPIVGIAQTGDDGGYWLVASDGGVFPFGDAAFYGSTGAIRLNKPIVGMAATPDGGGYWLVATDGGIFSYGDATFFGSTGSIRLNKPIVGMASTPDGGGYWLVASDGGIFSFGDATFYGSTGSLNLNKPIVGMASTPDGGGYWLVASDGGIFSYGDAQFRGSAGSLHLNQPIVGMAAMPDGSGYWFSAADGGLFNYGAPFYGSGAGQGLRNVVGIASDGSPTLQGLLSVPDLRAHLDATPLLDRRFDGPER